MAVLMLFFLYLGVLHACPETDVFLAESTGLGMIQIQNGSSSPTTLFLFAVYQSENRCWQFGAIPLCAIVKTWITSP